MMKKHFVTAILMTIVTTLLLGVLYPLAVTGIAQILFPAKANGQLITRNGQTIGSRIIGQTFTGDRYFHSRPSAAGSGYDAANSGGSNFGPTNRKLIARVAEQVHSEGLGGAPVPIDLATASGSGLDPHITPASAEYQVARVARARDMNESALRMLVRKHTQGRDLGLFGEPRVNVLELNLELDAMGNTR